MPYSTNPHIPKVRAQAVMLVKNEGWSTRQAARHFGVSHSTIVRWMKKAPEDAMRIHEIPTISSRPKSHPKATNQRIIDRIVEIRRQRGRCAQVIHAQLEREGIKVSLSTVKRTLERKGLLKKRSKWKRFHAPEERPKALKPGDLVQLDTIHIMPTRKKRMYIFTMIDCFSRWGYARATRSINAKKSLYIFRQGLELAPFDLACVQSDHGSEFSTHFSTMVNSSGIRHRHSRVRMPNDNAHVERFNRTIQEEMKPDIIRFKHNIPWLNRKINEYIKYYNEERLHMGLEFQTPLEVVRRS